MLRPYRKTQSIYFAIESITALIVPKNINYTSVTSYICFCHHVFMQPKLLQTAKTGEVRPKMTEWRQAYFRRALARPATYLPTCHSSFRMNVTQTRHVQLVVGMHYAIYFTINTLVTLESSL